MSYGLGPFGFGYGYSPPVPVDEAPIVLVSSQLVDLVTGTLAFDDDGNEVGMDDTGQRIVLLARTAEEPGIIGPDFAAAVEDNIRKALLPVTGGNPPDATVTSIAVTVIPGGSQKTITYVNNLTNTETSVTL